MVDAYKEAFFVERASHPNAAFAEGVLQAFEKFLVGVGNGGVVEISAHYNPCVFVVSHTTRALVVALTTAFAW